MQICVFVGTTAELIKLFPVVKALEGKGFEVTFCISGQNDVTKSALWSQLKPQKVVKLSVGPKFPGALGLIWWFVGLVCSTVLGAAHLHEEVEAPAVCIVHGDTVSTLLGAFWARRNGLKVAHVEAGLRSFSILSPFPEELCRILVSYLSHLSFCPNDWSVKNLRKRKSIKINTNGNTLLDVVAMAMRDPEIAPVENLPPKYFVFVLHRQENLIDERFVRAIWGKIKKESGKIPCLLILHHTTNSTFEKLGILGELADLRTVHPVPRLEFHQFIQLLSSAEFIVTDGGSNQEESFYLGKP
ncbi:MAG: UDP-N-acetylglucosamine 2-epimerase, partial [Bdellovibrionales bacterium]|nr:UDP-N-acetylglucosamine 2-epimerase [Bdellovibrionales bacterium]